MTTTQEIMKTFDAVWREAMHLPPLPRTMVLDRSTMEVIEVVSAEQRWLDRLNSPAGLKALFPALKG
jgi:hypothetical protein